MTLKACVTILIATTIVLSTAAPRGEAQTLPDAAARCEALPNTDFSGIPDAPTEVWTGKWVPAHERMRAYCAVTGSVAPTVGFMLLLPADHWNGKFLQYGCGGFCGPTYNGRVLFDDARSAKLDAFTRGYALLRFDGGHSGDLGSALWAYQNLPAQFDFGIRAPHVAALAGKAITKHFYQADLSRSYFLGCSTGGGQALSEAQRFPWDFDGIISGAPSPTFSGPMMNYLWAGKALAGKFTRADLKLVHDRALEACDMDDGVKDGVIGDPQHCPFDPAKLLCKAGESARCLTADQVAAVRKVYSGPTTSKGERIYTGGPFPGSELNWMSPTDDADDAYVNASGAISTLAHKFFSLVGFMPAPGPNWKIADFDFDRDYRRLRLAESLFGAADNPDLRKFKATGGKLLLYQGAQDQSDIPADAIDYYETAEKTMGGRAATQDFFRFFVIPGMNHCGGGDGAFAVDYLSYLEAWIEKGQAPDRLLSAHIRLDDPMDAYVPRFPLDPSRVAFTRPVYPYPLRAKYLGRGDPKDAANFGPIEP